MLFENKIGTPVSESLDTVVENFEGPYVEPTDRAFAQAIYGHDIEMAQMESALYIADAVIESQIMDGDLTVENASVVAEGSIKDFVKGVREKLSKLWEKIKAWFVSLKNSIKVYMTNTTKFFKQYASEIQKKAKNNKLEIKTYKYDITAAINACEEFQAKILDRLNKLCGAMGSRDVDAWRKVLFVGDNMEDRNEKFENTFWEGVYVKGTKCGNYGEVKENIYKIFRNGEAQKFKVSELPIDEFINYGKNANLDKQMEKAYKDIADNFKRSLNDLKKAESLGNSQNPEFKEKLTKYTHITATQISTFTSLYSTAGQLSVAMVKEFTKAGATVCKAIVARKAVSESAEVSEIGVAAESSLFNSILGSL